MKTSLKTLLLAHPVPTDGKPLFESAAQLSLRLRAVAPKRYRNPKNTAVLLSYLLRSERSCSDDLAQSIGEAVSQRLADSPSAVRNEWQQKVEQAIEAHNASFDVKRAESDEVQWDQLLERANRASTHFIITPLTAEQESGIDQARALNETLLRRLGISPMNERPPETRYCFLLPSRKTAQDFWVGLWERSALLLQGQKPPQWAETRLAYLDQKGFLEVYVVPRFVCGCPLVVFDPGSVDPAAFSFTYHPDNVIDTIRWDVRSLWQWTRNVHEAFHKAKTEVDATRLSKANADKFPDNFYGYRVHFQAPSAALP